MPDFAVMTAFNATDRLTSAFNRMGGAADRFGNRAQTAFGKANASGIGMMSAIKGLAPLLTSVGIFEFANKSIEAWREQEAAVANVRQALKSTGFAAGLTFQELDEMATNMMKGSIFADESILQNATAQLLTFTRITGPMFERTQQAILDVTSGVKGIKATGEDLLGFTRLIGRGIEDPLHAKAWRKAGIVIKNEEQKMMEAMVAGNNTIGARAYLLSILEKRYGGRAAAIAGTEKGQELQRANRINEMMEQIGQKLSPLKKSTMMFVEAILPVIIELMETLGGLFKMVNPGIQKFGDILNFIKPIIPVLVYGFILWKAAIWGVTFAKLALMGIGWISYIWMMRSVIMGAITRTVLWAKAQWLLNAAMSANPIGLIIIGIAALVTLIVLIVKHWNDWGAAMTALMGPFGHVISLVKTLYDNWQKVTDAFSNKGIWEGIKVLGGLILDSLLYPLQQLMELMADLPLIGQYAGDAAAAIRAAREAVNPKTEAPNKAETKRQTSMWEGTLNFANAPAGMTFQSQTWNAPPINVNGLGGNQ